MYRLIRIVRIVISLIAMGVPTWALIAGYESVFVRMQILTALMTGVSVTLLFWALVTIVYGRLYCSTVCPLGALMDCVSATSRMLRRKKQAYRWLQAKLDLPEQEAHIGRFSLFRCEQVIRLCEEYFPAVSHAAWCCCLTKER